MYKRVERQLCHEENLQVVVWRSIHEEFIRLYQRFSDLISKCYPGSGIKLEFDMSDLQEYFDLIAKGK